VKFRGQYTYLKLLDTGNRFEFSALAPELPETATAGATIRRPPAENAASGTRTAVEFEAVEIERRGFKPGLAK
jgi:hypothetical protein